jgi:hypothetical protein
LGLSGNRGPQTPMVDNLCHVLHEEAIWAIWV